MNWIIFRRDMRVTKNTLRGAPSRRKELRFAASGYPPDIRSASFFLLSPRDPLR